MFYTVGYVLIVLSAGATLGALLASPASRFGAAQLARTYYALIAVRVVLGSTFFICSYVAPVAGPWSSLNKVLGDATNFLLGALFGLAARRSKPLDVLLERDVYSALCLSAAYGILIAGVGKAFSRQAMADFFAQSGYPIAFLNFTMVAEILGGAALLIPWAVLPATLGITIDMLGAVFTHVHNGDPLNDSTGAIAMLIRLTAIVVVWILRPRASNASRSVRGRFIGAVVCAVFSIVAAAAGSRAMRRPSPSRTHGSGVVGQEAHRSVQLFQNHPDGGQS